MSCDNWKELWIDQQYEGLAPADAGRLNEHLGACSACRADFDGLAQIRSLLREAAPAVPQAPRVLILSRSPRRAPGWAWAAALAGFGVLAALSMSWAWQARAAAQDLAHELAARDERAPVPATNDEIDRRVSEGVERYLAARMPGSAVPAAPALHSEALTRKELNALFDRYDRKFQRERASDLRYVLEEIAGMDARTSARLGETQQAIRYVALASDPSLSAR